MTVQVGEVIHIVLEDKAPTEEVVIDHDLAGSPITAPKHAFDTLGTLEKYVGVKTARELAQRGLLLDELSA